MLNAIEFSGHAPRPAGTPEREAKVLASLNHPNIAQIYGIEDHAVVMELVPGCLKGPLTLETALKYAKQIAEPAKRRTKKASFIAL